MNIFCAYFDVQGFYIDKIFHSIEVCLADKAETLHVKVKKDCRRKPTKQEQKSMFF